MSGSVEIKKIAVCGLGKLGSPIAAAFSSSEIPVVGFDLDSNKVNKINSRIAPVTEPDLDEYLKLSTVRNNLQATTRVDYAVSLSDACLFVTPTPSLPDGSFDHSQLTNAIMSFAREVAKQKRRNYFFIINSTVTPRFLDSQVLPLVQRLCNSLHPRVAYKPEFIAIGTVLRDLHNPDFLLIGEDSDGTGAAVEALYRNMVFQNPEVKHMALIEAELAKISLNCAVTMKISYANQVGAVARKLGADPVKILDAVGTDRRIGKLALRPGLPFGGPCFPRDNRMFRHVASTVGEGTPIADAVDIMNRRVLRELLERVPLHGDVGILGLAYKPGTSLTDESAGMFWRHALKCRGRRVKCHDPQAEHDSTVEEVLACETVIVACPWPQYRDLRVPDGTVVLDPSDIVQTVERYRPNMAVSA